MEITRVVGRSPMAKTSSPRSELMNVLLPVLYSPTTTSRKSSSISCTSAARRSRSARGPSARASASRTWSTSRRSSATSSTWPRVRTCSISGTYEHPVRLASIADPSFRAERGILAHLIERAALYREAKDSSPPALRASARNDSGRFPATRLPLPHSWNDRREHHVERGIRPARDAGIDRDHQIVLRHDEKPLALRPRRRNDQVRRARVRRPARERVQPPQISVARLPTTQPVRRRHDRARRLRDPRLRHHLRRVPLSPTQHEIPHAREVAGTQEQATAGMRERIRKAAVPLVARDADGPQQMRARVV